ncbi:putative THO complex subunit 4 protein, partial [Naja naja]
MKQYNCVPLD